MVFRLGFIEKLLAWKAKQASGALRRFGERRATD
jgi:hypothetical protein